MTQSNLKFVDHICQRMIANGMVKSQAEFSSHWLEQSPSYLSSSKARNRQISDQAVQRLFERLASRMQNFQDPAKQMMGIRPWRQAYENTMLIHTEVQNYLTWRASDREAVAAFPPDRLDALRQRLAQSSSTASSAPLVPVRSSALGKLIQFAKMGKSR